MPVRRANAVWEGTLKDGKGSMKFGSFEGPYSFASRFEQGEGTNPEELIGAAHAGCFSQALSLELTQKGHEPKRLATTAEVHLNKKGDGFAIEEIQLSVVGEVDGIDENTFMEIANAAGQNCPVSKALDGVKISVKANLRS
jgi:osmotically inducible protein OsmC